MNLNVAVRALLRRRTQTMITVITIALIVGAGSAVLAVANAIWFQPLPFPDDARLVALQAQPPGTSGIAARGVLHGLSFARLRSGLAHVAEIEGLWARPRAITSDGSDADNVIAVQASAGALAMLSTGPTIGRTWTEDEDRASAKVAVISHGLWQRRFNGDPAILGRTIHVDRQAHEIIGVMPAGFNDLYLRGQLWSPLGIHTGLEAVLPSPRGTYIVGAARLKPGVTVARVDAEARRVMRELVAEQPDVVRGWDARAALVREVRFGAQTPALIILLLSLAGLAAIGCANLANVSIADLAGRRQELAMRTALGASRLDLARLELRECALLSAAGASLGLLLAASALPLLLTLDSTTASNLGTVTLDPLVILVAIAIASAIVVVSRLMPSLRRSGGDAARHLGGTRGGVGSVASRRTQRVMLMLQTGVAIVLVIGGGFLLKHYFSVARVDAGFEPRGLYGAQMRLGPPAYPTPQSRADFVRRAIDRLQQVPGVAGAATTLNLFTPGIYFITLVQIDGRPTSDGQPHSVQFRRVSPSYFRTAGIPLVTGRLFDDGDVFEKPRIAVVSRRFADEYWPGDDAVGRTLTRSGNTVTVVGVVGDVRDISLAQAPQPTMYVPFGQDLPPNVPTSFVIRAADRGFDADAVRAAVRSVDPLQPLDQLVPLDAWLGNTIGPERLRTALLVFLSGIGLLVAIVGVYGLTARAVGERRREVGVRLALGASHREIWRMLMLDTVGAAAVGLLAGGALAFPAARALQTFLPGLTADAITPALALAILGSCVVVAAAAPARRALAVQPTEALRGD
jgi:putative ABC transport system permease protein